MSWFRRRPKLDPQAASTPLPEPTPTSISQTIGGRRHLTEIPYVLPTDGKEIGRQELQHYLYRFAVGGQFRAPIPPPLSILDVGCGTGRWAIEMARYYPQANVIGLDIAVPDPDQGLAKPPNYLFIQGDLFKGLPFADASFDFVHMRSLFLAIPLAQWPIVIAELRRLTRPGGWVELIEPGVVQQGTPAMTQLMRWAENLGAKRGIDLGVGPRLNQFMAGARLERVELAIAPIPVGRFGGHIGTMMETDVFAVVESIRRPVVATGIVSDEIFLATVARARQEAQLGQWRGYWPVHICYGRRGF